MATPGHNYNTVPMDQPITIKISVNDSVKRFKLPLRDLGAKVLPDKLRHLLGIRPDQTVVFERFSDSAGGYVTLDPDNPQVFKSLNRAAKAKLKLRMRVTVPKPAEPTPPKEDETEEDATKGETKDEAKDETPAETPEHDRTAATEAVPMTEPTIVRSPVFRPGGRASTALDGRSVGSGIFQFRDSVASEQTLVNADELPAAPQPSSTSRLGLFNSLASLPSVAQGLPPPLPACPVVAADSSIRPWTVCCNECDNAVDGAHFHCNQCDNGDYDLCEDCVKKGKMCLGENHWLIKRYLTDGTIVTSTTERYTPRPKEPAPTPTRPAVAIDEKKEMPGAFADDAKTLTVGEEPRGPTRTCNGCVVVLPEREFVTCTTCDDFDLCLRCHTSNRHGHHPAHGFQPATPQTVLPLAASLKLAPGRNVLHAAICDHCDKQIFGVRHKCLNCPDWDYCDRCIKEAATLHPRHRFAPVYEPLAEETAPVASHFGIYCDGPLCSRKDNPSYITGVRYKCAVCADTDFCATCEALPGNYHNRTHPLIKFRTPVRNVSITTENEDLRGNVRMMGDRRRSGPSPSPTPKSVATETTPVQQAHTAMPVQTMADIQPTAEQHKTQPIPVIRPAVGRTDPAPGAPPVVHSGLLNAQFVHDTIPDGMVLRPGARFTQIWTVKNPGPYAWPAGCSVRFVGGDNMFNVDNGHPAAVADIEDAMESNVIGRDVQVGEDIAFKVALKAPVREGRSISYWRLKAADGIPFGHRLWCDIQIKAVESPPRLAAAITMPALPTRPRLRLSDALQQPPLDRTVPQRAPQADPPHAQQTRAAPPSDAPPAYEAASQARVIKPDGVPPVGPHTPPTVGSGSSSASADDKARAEFAKHSTELFRARIMRAKADRARAIGADIAAAAAEHKYAEEAERVEKIVEQVRKSGPADADAATGEVDAQDRTIEGSQMVYPKLDKESPASSTYQSATSSAPPTKGQAASVENEEGEVERAIAPSSAAVVSSPTEVRVDDADNDIDIEVLSAADGEPSDGDGFVTDEEYDILDASDEETVDSP